MAYSGISSISRPLMAVGHTDKTVKIQKGQPEAVRRRRTDNTPLFITTTTHSFDNLTDSQDIIKV
jgi:hypothetical protein